LRQKPSVDELYAGVRSGDRGALGRAITLIESTRADDQERGRELIERLLPHTGASLRVGITGVPGAGKSTLIEALGTRRTAAGTKVAVLAVDPSSVRTGGSILGDKTRMQELARNPLAFVRPSPSRGSLGGVARHTREAILLCESAGYELVIVETVGVGQSEIMVAGMVDVFVVLLLAGAGDELQGIKRGILELADVVAINKADGENLQAAKLARLEYERALRLMPRARANWTPPVVLGSGLHADGVDALWAEVERCRQASLQSGEWERHRAQQRVAAMWRAIEWGVLEALRGDQTLTPRIAELEHAVRDGKVSPDHAAIELLARFRPGTPSDVSHSSS
jgi:LAO/AO transport system kinase